MLYDFPILVTREQWNWSLNPSLFELLKVCGGHSSSMGWRVV